MMDSHGGASAQIEVTANYLPASQQFRQEFLRTATIGEVRTAIMAFFGVSDRTIGRQVYTYYLSFEGRRLDNLGETLAGLVGNERHTVHFQLLEEIKEG
ncbi:MAG TPA: hypothetical protein VEV38_09295 [Candidatus Eremiobacteraceae bacterium]|nr:hypothetical protein [Candidatus Eremiobacteraceae bacterium]